MIHIHNGDVTVALGRRAGLPGEHFGIHESLASGPMHASVDLEERARFLAIGYGHNLLRVRNDLLDQEHALDAAASHDEIVLWFEHDLFCLVTLLTMLDRFGDHRNVSLIWSPEPLGLKEAADFAPLFHARADVTPALVALARQALRAYRSSDPTALNDFLDASFDLFPFLREGFVLHASRFPSLRNGLGEVEQRALMTIPVDGCDFETITRAIDARGPRFGFGDTEVFRILGLLATCTTPLLTIVESADGLPRTWLQLTDSGRQVLNGELEHSRAGVADEWLGGVLVNKESVWRWSERARQIVSSPTAVS